MKRPSFHSLAIVATGNGPFPTSPWSRTATGERRLPDDFDEQSRAILRGAFVGDEQYAVTRRGGEGGEAGAGRDDQGHSTGLRAFKRGLGLLHENGIRGAVAKG